MRDTTALLAGGREWMLFVDGENLTKRGQESLRSAGIDLAVCPYWQRDVFLWLPGESGRRPWFARQYFGLGGQPTPPHLIVKSAVRAYYYTSTTSDEPGWTDTRLALSDMNFEPRLFKRAAGKSKAVDVALATEVLTLAVEGRYDVAVIFAGDGDYVPLVEAVKRRGRHVIVGFFKDNGLSPELRIAADDFIDIAERFHSSWRLKVDGDAKEAVKAANDTKEQAAQGT